jgi:hypothetical protein
MTAAEMIRSIRGDILLGYFRVMSQLLYFDMTVST